MSAARGPRSPRQPGRLGPARKALSLLLLELGFLVYWCTLRSHVFTRSAVSHPVPRRLQGQRGLAVGQGPAQPQPAGGSAAGHQPVLHLGLVLQMEPIRSQH